MPRPVGVGVRQPMGMHQPKSSVSVDVVEPLAGPTQPTRVDVVGRQGLGRPTPVDVVRHPGPPLANDDVVRQPYSSSMGADVVRPMPIDADVVHPPSMGVDVARLMLTPLQPNVADVVHPPPMGANVVRPIPAQVPRWPGVADVVPQPGLQPAVGVDVPSGIVGPSLADIVYQPGAATADAVADHPSTWTATQYVAARANAAEFASVRTMTAKSLRRLDRLTTSSDSSPHSRVIEWLQTSESMPSPSSVVEPVPVSEPQPSLPLGAEAVVSGPRSARVSRTSHSTRLTQCSVTSSMAAELLGFTKEISGHLMNAVGQMQTQAEAQRLDAQAQRAEARQREEVLNAMALKLDENNLAREQLLIQLKLNADQINAEHERMMAENDLKRQKMLVETNAALLEEKLQVDLQRDIEFQQAQQKERNRAVAAQQQLRELAAQELQERVYLERELAKQ